MRKNSKSLRKASPKKSTAKKECLKKCVKKEITPLNLQNSLYRKYSTSQNYYYVSIINHENFLNTIQQFLEIKQPQQYLEKYQRIISRKFVFPKIKEIYKLHSDIPRFFQNGIKQILDKCFHRKRLLDYFKIAKILGIKVESVKFSTFLLSVNDLTNKKIQNQKQYDPIITLISSINFSQEVQKNLLQELNGCENMQRQQNKCNSREVSTALSFW